MKYRRALRMAPFWIALIVLITMATKSSPNNQLYLGADKLYHWIGFAVLTFSAHIAFPRLPLGALMLCMLGGAAAIELIQAFSPSRTPSLSDMTANLIGVLTGMGATQLERAKRSPEQGSRRRSSKRHRRHRSSEDRSPQKEPR